MLVLSRREGQGIVITLPNGDRVTVTNCGKNRQGEVKIGVVAPAGVTVHRDEIQRKIDGKKEEV